MIWLWTRAAVCALVVASLAGLAGCNANKPKDPLPIPDGPVVSMENPEGVQLRDIPPAANEPDLVERVIFYRSMYARSLRALRDHYKTQGNQPKRVWAENELRQVWQIKPYRYILDVEVPLTTAKPTETIDQADQLYNQGLLLLEQASECDGAQKKELLLQSLAKFRELAEKYPASDKMDKACYYVGMIHYQYFPDDAQIALAWYKKAYELNPNIAMPARYESARIYDDRLKDRDKALEMYRQVLKHEKFNKINYDYATRRLVQLTTKGQDTGKQALQPAYKQ